MCGRVEEGRGRIECGKASGMRVQDEAWEWAKGGSRPQMQMRASEAADADEGE